MKHKKSRKIKGGFNWKFWEPNVDEPNKPKTSWFDSFKNYWKKTPTSQPTPQGSIVQPKPNPVVNPDIRPQPQPQPQNNGSPSLPESMSITKGGKKSRKKRRKTKKHGGHYKAVHHTNTARPTYYLNY